MNMQNWVWGLSPSQPELLEGQFYNKGLSLLPPCPFPGPRCFILASSSSAPALHSTAAAPTGPAPHFLAFPSLLSCLTPHRCLSLLLPGGPLMQESSGAPPPSLPGPCRMGVGELRGRVLVSWKIPAAAKVSVCRHSLACSQACFRAQLL